MSVGSSDESEKIMENYPYEIAVPRPKPTPLEFLEAVYSNEGVPLQARLKAAIEAAQYVHPKLSVTTNIEAGDFAVQLDRAVERSRRVMIGAKPVANVSSDNVPNDTADVSSDTTRPASNGHKPSVVDRRYRRW
jgi:hypothetical protein